MSRFKKIGIGVLILALAAGSYSLVRTGLAAEAWNTAREKIWSSLGFDEKNKFVPPPPPKVTWTHPVTRYVADTIEFTGTTQATARVDLRAQVSGKLKSIHFEDGMMVEADQLLFTIEPAPFLAERDAAKARLQKAQASLQLAEANLERIAGLYRRNAATKQEHDVQVAERAGAAAEVAVAEAVLAQAELELSHTEIHSPIGGRISRHLVDVGNLIREEETMLATIESIDKIHVYFYLSELELLRFMDMLRQNKLPDPDKVEIPIRMGLANDTDFPYEGKLDYRQTSVDPGTGTIERRAIFDNEDRTLIPGLFVRLQANVGNPQERLLVEERALGSDQRGDFLLIIRDDDTIEQRHVELGTLVDGMRVVLNGLDAQDRVVVNGLQRARPGAAVTPEQLGTQPEDEAAEPSEEPITKAGKEKSQVTKNTR